MKGRYISNEIISTTADSEIVNSRIFEFPVKLVYKAWSDPDNLKNWWGPAGFTNTFHEFDFRVGGRWTFTMHGPGKGHYANECEFIEIKEPSIIAWKRFTNPIFQVVATFEVLTGEKTKVVFKMLFNTAEECAKLKPYVVDKNEENFDRLEIELSKM